METYYVDLKYLSNQIWVNSQEIPIETSLVRIKKELKDIKDELVKMNKH